MPGKMKTNVQTRLHFQGSVHVFKHCTLTGGSTSLLLFLPYVCVCEVITHGFYLIITVMEVDC